MITPNVRVATGFYTNWDSLTKVDDRVLAWVKKHPKIKPRKVILSSLEEAAYTLDEALKIGGKEYLISKEVYDRLNSTFSFEEKRLGGNGCNMGLALYEIGLTPLVSYPFRPPNLMLKSPDFKVACRDGFKKPKQAVRRGDPEYDHLIFEYKEEPEKGIHISGRHILSWDLMSFQGIFDGDFFFYAFSREYTDILVFAYAHLLLPEYREKTREVADRLSEGKRPKVHFELGEGSFESVKYAIKIFSDSQCTDSWGLNEKECVKYFGAESESLEDVKDAALEAAKKYGLDRVCVHTSAYSFSISRFDVGKEVEALTKASMVAAAKTMGSVRENLDKVSSLPTTEVRFERGRLEGYNFCLVPAYKNPNPKILTGLGDAFAAVQATFALT